MMLKTDRLGLYKSLEQCEAAYWGKHYSNTTDLKAHSTWVKGALVCALPELDVLAMNRVIGIGFDEEVLPDDVDEIIDFFRQAGSKRFFIQVSPHQPQSDLPELLASKGFTLHNRWAKLVRPVNTALTGRARDLSVKAINSTAATVFGNIIHMSFDWEDARIPNWFGSVVGKEGFRHYLVYKEATAIAAGALHIHGTFASLAIAGTLPGFRGLGAQSLLITTRIKAARAAGCKYIVVETGEDTPEKPNQSFRNVVRHGFEIMYLRENWIYII